MLLAAFPGHAHLLGESYAFIRFADGAFHLRTDLPLERLDEALALDHARDGKVDEQGVDGNLAQILGYIQSGLGLESEDTRYRPAYLEHEVWAGPNGRYLSVHFLQANVGEQPNAMTARYELFFEHDPDHRGILELLPSEASEKNAENGRILAIFAPGRTQQAVRLDAGGAAVAREALPDPRYRGGAIAAVTVAACGLVAFGIVARGRAR